MTKGNIFVFIFCVRTLLEEGASDPSMLRPSRFAHVPPVVTAIKSVTKPTFLKVSLAFTFCVTKFVVLTSEPRHVCLFGLTLCGRFVPTEKLINFNQYKWVKFSKTWSANESRPSFFARPVEGVALNNEMGRGTEGIQKKI
jgi:hypothetical protein